tara:strand:- start:5086 stop:5979 length:894 start_codon:yes stop_codon:yes gene_type:complete
MKDVNIKRQDIFNKNYIKNNISSYKGFPVFSSIELNIHGSCNRRCAFCPRVDEEVWPNLDEKLDLDFFKKILKELSDNNYKGRIGFSGFSEPFLHPELLHLVKLHKKFLPQNRLEITTNGDYLDEDIVKELFNNGLYGIKISLYTNPKNQIKFENIRENLKIDTDRFFVRGRNQGSKNDFGLVLNNRAGSVDYERIGKNQKKILPLKQSCNYPMFKMFIDYNGDCLLCSNDWAKKRVIGNAKNQNIYDIWVNEKINSIRKKLLNNDRNYNPCANCDVDGLLNGSEFAKLWESSFAVE